MKHRFHCTPEVAHSMTKAKKKEKFYFRTLTRTDHIETVLCETSDAGWEYIAKNNINIEAL